MDGVGHALVHLRIMLRQFYVAPYTLHESVKFLGWVFSLIGKRHLE